MKCSVENQVLALAAVTEAAALVDQLATRGHSEADTEALLIESLFSLDAGDLDDIYGDTARLRPALERLLDQLATSALANLDVARYQMGMLALQRRLQSQRAVRQRLRDGLQQLIEFRRLSQPDKEQLNERIALLYQETISGLSPRIMVKGKSAYLQGGATASRIRVLLLAGIRSGVLWQQAGGTRWSLLFGRRAYLESAERLLAR